MTSRSSFVPEIDESQENAMGEMRDRYFEGVTIETDMWEAPR